MNENDNMLASDEAYAIEPSETSDRLLEEEKADLEDSSLPPQKVTYKGQDIDVYGLVRRINKENIIIPQFGNKNQDIETAGFQRGFVWKKSQMDRFIESIILEYPIPGIFLVKQSDEKMLVLDGQQRLTTLQLFLNDQHKLGKLSINDDKIQNKYFKDLPEKIQRQIEDYSIQVTTLTAATSDQGPKAIYQIFERLNSGGTMLTAHEIRIALFAGNLVDKIQDLNLDPSWRNMYGPLNGRVRDHELVTRIIALYMNWRSYSKPLKNFLNDFYQDYSGNSIKDLAKAFEIFKKAADLLDATEGKSALRSGRQLNIAWSDAIFVALMTKLQDGVDISLSELKAIIDSLRENEEFLHFITGPTSDDIFVENRITIALESFGIYVNE